MKDDRWRGKDDRWRGKSKYNKGEDNKNNACKTFKCLNGGRCFIDGEDNEPNCACQKGYQGNKCQISKLILKLV